MTVCQIAPGAAVSTAPASHWLDVHPALGISMMDHLFNRLDGAYPHKWRSNFATPQAIANWRESWAEAFEDERIKPADIAVGLRACRSRYDWPPSCAEFVKACKPAVDPLVAYDEAVEGCNARDRGERGMWSHPAIFWAASSMAFDLKSKTYAQVKTRWERALCEQMAREFWEAVPDPALALPAPGKADLSSGDAARMLQGLDVMKSDKRAVDHLRWAKRIMERERFGDRLLCLAAVKSAREALGVVK